MKRILRAGLWLVRNIEEIIGSACLACMGLVTAYNVVCRYAFNSAKSWAEELAVICLTWAVFMGSAAAYKRNLHAGMDFFVARLPKKAQHWLRTAVMVLLTAFFVYITVIGWQFTTTITKTTTYFRISYFYLDIAVVLCFFSMTVYSLVYLFQAVFQPEKYDRRYQALDDENEPDATRTELASTSGGVK